MGLGFLEKGGPFSPGIDAYDLIASGAIGVGGGVELSNQDEITVGKEAGVVEAIITLGKGLWFCIRCESRLEIMIEAEGGIDVGFVLEIESMYDGCFLVVGIFFEVGADLIEVAVGIGFSRR